MKTNTALILLIAAVVAVGAFLFLRRRQAAQSTGNDTGFGVSDKSIPGPTAVNTHEPTRPKTSTTKAVGQTVGAVGAAAACTYYGLGALAGTCALAGGYVGGAVAPAVRDAGKTVYSGIKAPVKLIGGLF